MRWIIAGVVCYFASAFLPGLDLVWPGSGGMAYTAGLMLGYLVAPLLLLIGIVRIWRSRSVGKT